MVIKECKDIYSINSTTQLQNPEAETETKRDLTIYKYNNNHRTINIQRDIANFHFLINCNYNHKEFSNIIITIITMLRNKLSNL